MSNELQLSDYLSAIDQKFDELNSALYNQNIMLASMSKTISQLNCDLSDLKERVYKDELSSLSSCPWGNFAGIDARQLDIDEQNFDNAWYEKHYRVDCPEYDQPLSLDELHNFLRCDIPLELYQKYKESVEAENTQKTEEL